MDFQVYDILTYNIYLYLSIYLSRLLVGFSYVQWYLCKKKLF